MSDTPPPSPVPCRVCGAVTESFFTKLILGKHQVAYFKCPSCGQVQTEKPYWLEEAYNGMFSRLDVGMADRCIWTALTTVTLARKLGIGREAPCLDWGAGTGLLVRLCRDYGMNYFYTDPYAENIFAAGFELNQATLPREWACITAFEVAEHLPDPLKNFGEILQLSPRYLLFSTLLYSGQPADWWYFTNNGQHVAFYTRRSLQVIANHYGYQLASNDCDLHLFSRERVRDGILDSSRKSRESGAARYRKKHGSRTLADFESVARQLQSKT